MIEIWFAARDRTIYLISGGHDRSDWVRNLVASPVATVRVGDRHLDARARVALPHGEEREAAVRALHGKYGSQVSSTVDDWLARAFIVALDVEGETT